MATGKVFCMSFYTLKALSKSSIHINVDTFPKNRHNTYALVVTCVRYRSDAQ